MRCITVQTAAYYVGIGPTSSFVILLTSMCAWTNDCAT